MSKHPLYLLREECDLLSMETQIIEEKTDHPSKTEKKYYIVGPYVQADKKNGNGRTYPGPVLENQVMAFQKRIESNRAMGELGHPATTEINLDRVSHLIKELRMDGKNGLGKAVLMDTPMGKIAKSLVDEGVKLGVSSRGVGTLKNSVVQGDYKLITVDIVADPSAPDAFVEGILEGKREWILENGILIEKDVEELEEKKEEYASVDIKTATTKVFTDFLEKLRKNI